MVEELRGMVDEGMDEMRLIKDYRFEYAVASAIGRSDVVTAVFSAVCFFDSDLMTFIE
ncbi:MAG: hypothetical protein SH859_01110 [Hyphomicrobium aestuarii]|nr:hypothetical protein [Hyphomicrobium aestuarii]